MEGMRGSQQEGIRREACLQLRVAARDCYCDSWDSRLHGEGCRECCRILSRALER